MPDLIDLIDVLNTFTVTKTLTNVTTTNDDTKVIAGNSFHMDLSVNDGLMLNRVQVIMGGVDITDQAFSPLRDYYSVTSILTGVSSANNDFEAIAGDSFHMDLIPDSGKVISSVTVMMAGVDITSQVFTPGVAAKTITANGTYDPSLEYLSGYSSVTVNVPNSYSASDEGKVVSSGALVSQTSASYTVNGTYDTTEINSVTVNVTGSYSTWTGGSY